MESRLSIMSLLQAAFRGWISLMALIGTLVVVMIIGALLLVQDSDSGFITPTISKTMVEDAETDNVVAVVNLNGPIVDSDSDAGSLGVSSSLITAKRTITVLKHLAADESVKAVVLRINSPGGTVVASDEIYQHVKQLREKKPVVASLSDVAASGGYYIAAGANTIVANPATITGSVGVIAQFPELSGLFSKIGVEMRTFKSGEFKDIGSASRKMTPAEEAILNSIVNDSYEQFIKAIIAGRSMEEVKVRTLATGQIYTGLQAKENGLVDELGTFDTAVEIAKKASSIETAKVVEYTNASFWESFLQTKQVFSPLAGVERLLQGRFGVYYLMSW